MENIAVAWLNRRVKGVSNVLKFISKKVVDSAWTIGTVTTVVVYPLAMSIIEERIIQNYK